MVPSLLIVMSGKKKYYKKSTGKCNFRTKRIKIGKWQSLIPSKLII